MVSIKEKLNDNTVNIFLGVIFNYLGGPEITSGQMKITINRLKKSSGSGS